MRGFMNITTTCSQCHGRGKKIINICKSCSGSGVKKEQKEVSVEIPAGVRPGQTIRVPHGGNRDAGNQPGDLFVELHCRDRDFGLQGCDLVKNINVNCFDACVGSSDNIETLDGLKTISIPKGIQHGNKIKLKGLGFPKGINSAHRGDLLLHVNIKIPTDLSAEQTRKIRDI